MPRLYRYRRGLSRRRVPFRRRGFGFRRRRFGFRRRFVARRRFNLRRGRRRRFLRRGGFKKRRRSMKRPLEVAHAHADIFPKPSKSLTRKVMDVLNPAPVVAERESFSKTPITYAGANAGKPCAWVFARDATASASILGATTHYPFMPFDLAALYNTIWMKGTASAGGLGTTWPFFSWWGSTLATAPSVASFNWAPNDDNTALPHDKRYLRVGFYGTWTVTNSCNRWIDVRGFKFTPRMDLDGYTYSANILSEYCDGLWQSGIGTDVNKPLTDANFSAYLMGNDYDLFDAHTLMKVIKINKVRDFRLGPGKSKTFIIKHRPRRHWMRRWLNDSIVNTGALTTDCPWVRLRQGTEWIFKYTMATEGAPDGYDPYPAGNPTYGILTESSPGVVTLNYNCKYYAKMMPIPPVAARVLLGISGQGATDVNTIEIDDSDVKSNAASFA